MARTSTQKQGFQQTVLREPRMQTLIGKREILKQQIAKLQADLETVENNMRIQVGYGFQVAVKAPGHQYYVVEFSGYTKEVLDKKKLITKFGGPAVAKCTKTVPVNTLTVKYVDKDSYNQFIGE